MRRNGLAGENEAGIIADDDCAARLPERHPPRASASRVAGNVWTMAGGPI